MKTQTNILNKLQNYRGTEKYFKVPFTEYVYTDGVKALIDLCGCFWLISDIGIEIGSNKKLQVPFSILKIKVNKDSSCEVTLREDSDLEPILMKRYEYTDFPLEEYELYFIDKVFLLKGEY